MKPHLSSVMKSVITQKGYSENILLVEHIPSLRDAFLPFRTLQKRVKNRRSYGTRTNEPCVDIQTRGKDHESHILVG